MLPPLPEVECDPRYDDDATFRRVQHREAQSRYRTSDKGRAAQAEYRRRVGRDAEYAKDNARRTTIYGETVRMPTPEGLALLMAKVGPGIAALAERQAAERAALTERLKGGDNDEGKDTP